MRGEEVAVAEVGKAGGAGAETRGEEVAVAADVGAAESAAGAAVGAGEARSVQRHRPGSPSRVVLVPALGL